MIRKQTHKTWLIALCFMMMPSLLMAQSYAKKTLLTIGDKKITAEEFVDIRIVSSYGTVLPEFIFGEKGEKISDEDSHRVILGTQILL